MVSAQEMDRFCHGEVWELIVNTVNEMAVGMDESITELRNELEDLLISGDANDRSRAAANLAKLKGMRAAMDQFLEVPEAILTDLRLEEDNE